MQAENACAHHWKISSPQGATSPGRCSKCGKKKQFMNSRDDYQLKKTHAVYIQVRKHLRIEEGCRE